MNERFVVEDCVCDDTKTGLQWEADHHGPMTWYEAQKYAKALRLGGHADWRVPTVEELFTIVDFSHIDPASAFPGMIDDSFWSSSSYFGHSAYAWYVIFFNGIISYNSKTTNHAVRCVRRGPVDLSDLGSLGEQVK